jgi:hypothetical protein
LGRSHIENFLQKIEGGQGGGGALFGQKQTKPFFGKNKQTELLELLKKRSGPVYFCQPSPPTP